MEDLMIFAIIAVIALAAIAATVRKLRTKSSCCGSAGTYVPKKKKLKHVTTVKTFHIDGMHCEKCSNRVMEVINDFPDASAEVNLKTGTARVSYAAPVPDEQIRAAIERVGYVVTKIEG